MSVAREKDDDVARVQGEIGLLKELAAGARAAAIQVASKDARIAELEGQLETTWAELLQRIADLAACRAHVDRLEKTLSNAVEACALLSEMRSEPIARAALPVFDPSLLCSALKADLKAELEAAHELQLHKASMQLNAHKGEITALQDVIKVLQSDVTTHTDEKKELRHEIAKLKVENATLKALVPISAQRHIAS